MCRLINTVQSIVWLRRAVRRRGRSRQAATVGPDKEPTMVDAASPASVPAGHVAVRVEGARTFVVRLVHLSHPAFLELLRQAEEEYGFPPGASGPLALPCDEDRLRDVLRRVSSSSSDSGDRSCHGDSSSRPLLQRMAMEKLVS